MARLHVREGALAGGLPYLTFGHGRPLIAFRGLSMANANPTGLGRFGEVRMLAPLARAFSVYSVGRKPGLAPGTTIADLAADYARALESEFVGPVDVLGISTGGSIAQQFAVDHPNHLRRLVLAGAAYRLGSFARDVLGDYADLAARGERRAGLRAMAPAMVESRAGQRVVGGLLWLAGPLLMRSDPSDMVATIRAENAWDLGDRLGEISAPTLVIGGDRDRFYSSELFRQTAERIPGGRLRLYPGRDHNRVFVDRRFAADVIEFLTAPGSARPVAAT